MDLCFVLTLLCISKSKASGFCLGIEVEELYSILQENSELLFALSSAVVGEAST